MDILYNSANQSPAPRCQKPSSPVFFHGVGGQVEALYLLEPLSLSKPLFSLVAAYKWRTLVRGLPGSNGSHGLNPITLNYFCRALCLSEPAIGYFQTKQPVESHCVRG